MRRISSAFLALLFFAATIFAIDGISVTTRTTSTNAYGHSYGSIFYHVIKNTQVTESVETYSSADARCVSISPNGDRIAFLRADNKLCVKSMAAGGTVTVVCDVPKDAWIDWPVEGYIYFTNAWNGKELGIMPNIVSFVSAPYLPNEQLFGAVSEILDCQVGIQTNCLVGTRLPAFSSGSTQVQG